MAAALSRTLAASWTSEPRRPQQQLRGWALTWPSHLTPVESISDCLTADLRQLDDEMWLWGIGLFIMPETKGGSWEQLEQSFLWPGPFIHGGRGSRLPAPGIRGGRGGEGMRRKGSARPTTSPQSRCQCPQLRSTVPAQEEDPLPKVSGLLKGSTGTWRACGWPQREVPLSLM